MDRVTGKLKKLTKETEIKATILITRQFRIRIYIAQILFKMAAWVLAVPPCPRLAPGISLFDIIYPKKILDSL